MISSLTLGASSLEHNVRACTNFTELASDAHENGLADIDGALWHLTEQMLVLTELAEFQKMELQKRHMRVIEAFNIVPTSQAIRSAAEAAANPATPEGLAL